MTFCAHAWSSCWQLLAFVRLALFQETLHCQLCLKILSCALTLTFVFHLKAKHDFILFRSAWEWLLKCSIASVTFLSCYDLLKTGIRSRCSMVWNLLCKRLAMIQHYCQEHRWRLHMALYFHQRAPWLKDDERTDCPSASLYFDLRHLSQVRSLFRWRSLRMLCLDFSSLSSSVMHLPSLSATASAFTFARDFQSSSWDSLHFRVSASVLSWNSDRRRPCHSFCSGLEIYLVCPWMLLCLRSLLLQWHSYRYYLSWNEERGTDCASDSF